MGWNDWWAGDHTEGTLLISVFDPASQLLLWRAYCSLPINRPQPQQRVEALIHRAFKDYPLYYQR